MSTGKASTSGVVALSLLLFITAVFVILWGVSCLQQPSPGTPTPTVTATLIPPPLTLTPTKKATAAPTATVKPTMTATVGPTLTLIPTQTQTPRPTATTGPAATPVIEGTYIGWASYYATGVFQQVMDAHREFAKYPPGLSPGQVVSVADCRWKRDGRQIYLRPLDATTRMPLKEWLQLYIVDCAGDMETADWMRENNIIVEIDESLWDEWYEFHDRNHGLLVEMALLE